MKKNIMFSLIVVLALALMVVALQLTPVANTSYFIVALILMAAYCIGQYRFSKDFDKILTSNEI
ncbi:MAG: hypothetical protein II418_00605 [Firmicutes bacterium]|nr:hypothetical protein [Bacillota bacterium]